MYQTEVPQFGPSVIVLHEPETSPPVRAGSPGSTVAPRFELETSVPAARAVAAAKASLAGAASAALGPQASADPTRSPLSNHFLIRLRHGIAAVAGVRSVSWLMPASHPPPPRWESTAVGLGVAVLCVAVSTALIYPLREITPAVSTGVVYMLAVLVVSIYWGLAPGLFTAVASAAAFNFFHIPPTGNLDIANGENWVALAVFLAAAAIVSSLAEQSRARQREAEQRRGEANRAMQATTALLLDRERAAGGDDRDRGPAPQRRRQDRSAARRLPRPSLAADGDHRRRRGAVLGADRGRRPPGAGARRHSRGGSPLAPRRQASRPLSAGSRARPAATGLVLDRGGRGGGGRGPR